MAIKISGVTLGTLTGGPSAINLSDLHDVSIVSPATGQYLRYNSSISEWQNSYLTSDIYDYLNTNLTSSNGIALTKLSGPKTIDIYLSLAASGDATGTVTSGSLPLTLATVNSNVGTFGSSSLIPIITVNAKGLITAVSTTSFTATTATNLSGGTTGAVPYQSAPSTTTFLTAGTTSQVLVSGASAPSWTNTPTLTGTNFTGIPNAGLVNDSVTIGSTNIALGATATTLAGLSSVTSTTFVGALTGNASTATSATSATTATNVAGGVTGNVPYQTAASTTGFVTNAAGVLQALTSGATPTFTTTPALTGTNFTSIPNGALTNSSVTIGSTNIALGATSTTLAGLASVTSTAFVGTLTGNASTATALAASRSITASGDADWTVNFDGSANVTAALTLATVNSNIGQFAVQTVNAKGLVTAATTLGATGDVTGTSSGAGIALTLATVNASPQTDTFRKITVNAKGLTTATSAVTSGDITTALGFTPVNKAGDTMTGALILNADPGTALGAATKQYVDNVAAGLNAHNACVTSTTTALPTSTYSNGASGVGATLTANANGAIGTVGGYASLVVTDRVLVKDQASTLQNGIYVVTQLGSAGTPWILTRSSDFDGSPTSEITAGDFTFVQNGTIGGTQWVMTTSGTITVGTTGIVWSQLSGSGTYVAGTGILISSNVISNTGVLSNVSGTGISVSGATGNVTVTNTGVTSVSGTSNQVAVSGATGAVTFSLPTAVTISGTMTAGTFSGSGASLTSIPNGALTNSSLTIGSTSIALGATSTTLAGLTSVTSTSFTGALTGNASTATNISGGVTGNVPYQTAASTTGFVTNAAGVLQALTSGATPTFTTTPALVGTNFTGIPNAGLTNNSLTVGSTNIALGATSTTLAGLTSVSSTSLTTGGAGFTASATSMTLGGNFAVTSNTINIPTPILTLASVSNTANSAVGRFSADTAGPSLTLAKSRGTTLGTQGLLSITDTIGTVNFNGSDGTSMQEAAWITSTVDGTAATGIMPGRMALWTRRDGAAIATLGSITGGTGYTNGSYTNVRLTGGSGLSATANITVAGGIVTVVTLVSAGLEYRVGDALSAPTAVIGAGTGFTIPVATVAANTVPVERLRIDSRGCVGLTTLSSNVNLRVAKDLTGSSTSAYGVYANGNVLPDVLSNAYGYASQVAVASSAESLGTLTHFLATSGTNGTRTIDVVAGFAASLSLGLKGTANYGFFGGLAADASNWNLYMNGPAQNFIAGNVGIGSGKTAPATALDVNGTVTATAFAGDLTGNVTGNATTATTATNLASGVAGAIPYQTAASTTGFTSAGTTGQVLRSTGTTAPAWSAATYPSTTVVNQLLYSGTANVISGLTTANTSALVTNSTGVPGFTSGTTANRVLRTNGSVISFGQVVLTSDVTGTLPVTSGGTGTTASTGSGNLVLSASPTFTGTVALPAITVTGTITQAHTVTDTSAPAVGITGTLDSFATATYRSAKYLVQISQSTTYEILELLVVHNGTTAFVTEYGRTSTTTPTAVEFDASITSGTLSVTWVGGTVATTIKSIETYITV